VRIAARPYQRAHGDPVAADVLDQVAQNAEARDDIELLGDSAGRGGRCGSRRAGGRRRGGIRPTAGA
jgi:hypothetical protein